MGKVLRIEIYKILHQRRLGLAVAALAAFSFLLQLGFLFQDRNPLAMVARRGEFDLRLVLNSINTTRLIVNASYYVFLPILAAMIFAGQVAGERAGGTLWGILSRPVSRNSLLFSKFIASTGALLAIVIFFVGFTLLVGCTLFGVYDFLASPRIFDLLDGSQASILSFREGVFRLLLTACLLAFLLLPTGAIAFYCSLVFRNTHTAMATSLLIFFASYIIQGLGNIEWLTLFSSLKPYLFTTAMEAWIYIFYPEIGWNEILPRVVLLLIYLAAILSAGMIHFRYLDFSD